MSLAENHFRPTLEVVAKPVQEAPDEVWASATERARKKAESIQEIVQAVIDRIEYEGLRVDTAIDWLLMCIEAGELAPRLKAAVASCARKGKRGPSKASIKRWYYDFTRGGKTALLPKHRGRGRASHGWESRAIRLFQNPAQPSVSTVAYWLREEGYETASESRVRRYLNAQPKTATTHAPARVGRHFADQNLKPYIVRDHSETPVGFCYQGDGHTCDVYVQHPATGNHFRPELTAWIDVRTNFIVGWYLSESESAVTTLYALSHAIVQHDHVPAAIHTDPGSGFTNRMMDDQVTGYLSRLSIEPIRAIPGNAKGKGLIERWFGIFEERCGKSFATYCGHCRTDDLLSRFETRVRRGEIEVPTLAQYMQAVAAFVESYNQTAQRNLGGVAPIALWRELERVPVELAAEAIVRPQERRKVRRWGINLFKQIYRHDVLAGRAGEEVIVEYDLHDGSTVTIRDLSGRFLCDAELVVAKPGLPQSRIEQLRQKRLAGQIDRKQRQITEMSRRASLTHNNTEDLVKTLGQVETPALDDIESDPILSDLEGPSGEEVEIDLTRVDY